MLHLGDRCTCPDGEGSVYHINSFVWVAFGNVAKPYEPADVKRWQPRQTELALDLLEIGDRVIELPGLPSQRCGTVLKLMPYALAPDFRYPVVLWDSGSLSFSSVELGLRRLAPVEQLSLI
jgi:hypothetical protein